ncbi:nucleotide-diphospho-sugar transferase [Clavulina sp. PMI_390]|nr:nucleotide-diphospho-sugar transferase [Clavulina sp. PMI_390]
MLQSALEHLASVPSRTFEFIIVNDGSSDETESVVLAAPQTIPLAQEMSSQIRLVSLSRNRGKGAAVKQGCLHARGRRLLMVDADGASQFGDLELLWKALDRIEFGGQGVAIGSRAHLVDTDAVVKRSFVRNLLMHGLHLCLRTLGVGHIRDTQCGFKLFTRQSARSLFPPLHIAHWIFDVEILVLAQLLRIPVVEVPIAWHEVQGSKINLIIDSLAMLRDLVILRTNFAIGRWEVKLLP